ncbi:MAG: HAD family hydrolase [Bdellovibrionaceae bacterium]|nr:HAD family hydrolase [Pseudobdellovibrionaceae bacterium]
MNSRSAPILQHILLETAERRHRGEHLMMVFDLDSTLFDVSPRIQRILHDFAGQADIVALDPVNAALLASLKAERHDWGIRTIVERAGLHLKNPELINRAREFWIRHFFSNEYLRFDQPLPGAVDFVRFVEALGVKLIYLTGRDTSKMLSGSLEGLRAHRFPLAADGAELVMKPATGIEDHAFKEQWFDAIPKGTHGKIWFYENEPVNLDKIRVRHPEVELIFVDTTHSRKMPSPSDLRTIDDFRVDWAALAKSLPPIYTNFIPR